MIFVPTLLGVLVVVATIVSGALLGVGLSSIARRVTNFRGASYLQDAITGAIGLLIGIWMVVRNDAFLNERTRAAPEIWIARHQILTVMLTWSSCVLFGWATRVVLLQLLKRSNTT
jgi:hypothetical protein